VLLDHFATLLVSPRSSRGAKGRLARRLYGTLLKLQRRGLVTLEEGLLCAVARLSKNPPKAAPVLNSVLERMLFKALLAEDGQGDGHTPATLLDARFAFLSGALEAGWPLGEAVSALGVDLPYAAWILKERAVRKFFQE
jgi:hypothetical protein